MDLTNISTKAKNECSGCALCAYLCPKQAITMQPDTLGFKYPIIDFDKCINCGLCVSKCSFTKPSQVYSFEQKYYAIRHNDESELLKSQSGAAFVILSDIILQKGGVVYGAAFDDSFHVLHKRAMNVAEREELRYSKYTQSDIEKCYSLIRDDLESGRQVLFSGTPCQVAAIKNVCPSHLREHLFLVDLICHGVPSPYIWYDYLKYIEKRYGKIKKAYFRDKRKGWNIQKETFVCNREHSFITFKKLFYLNICLRKSCYNCYYSDYTRCSDLTIGDFWGWEKISNKHIDNKGVSLVLVNSVQGFNLFSNITQHHFIQEVTREDCIQPNLISPSIPHNKRDKFEEEYNKYGFNYIANIYSDLNLRTQLRYCARAIKRYFLKLF